MKNSNPKTWYFIAIATCLLLTMFALRLFVKTEPAQNLVAQTSVDSVEKEEETLTALPQQNELAETVYATTNADGFEDVKLDVSIESLTPPLAETDIQEDQDSDRPSWALPISTSAPIAEPEPQPSESEEDGRPSWAATIPDAEPIVEDSGLQFIEEPFESTSEDANERPSWAVSLSDAEPEPFVETGELAVLQSDEDAFLESTESEEIPSWDAVIPDSELVQQAEPVLQVSQESVLEPLTDIEGQNFSRLPKVAQSDQSVLDFESKPTSDPAGSATTDEVRIASLPDQKDKPKFRKFGASKPRSKTTDKDDEDEDDEPPAKQPGVLSASKRWKMAGVPKKGDRYKDDTPLTDSCSMFVEGAHGNFSPTPTMQGMPYDPYSQMNVYEGKQLYSNQRPLLELGRPWHQLGPISEGSSILGFHNQVNPQYLIFGDARTGFASNRVGGDSTTLVASQLNLFHHFKFTSTERFVAGMSPLTSRGNNSRYIFDDEEFEFEGNANFNFGFMEGDLGAIAGGAIGQTLPFDLPFAAGVIPLVFQNGIWMEDEILGFAVTIPARNSARFDISNMDITFFAGYDKLDSPAFEGDDSAARVMGIATFLDALNGHFEIDYAFLDDRTNQNRSYHNIGIGYTRRYGRFISNSTRIIVNAGQQNGVPGTADGVLLLSENSLITGFPSTVVPYFNMFAGFDQPQSVGRNGLAGGILRNTGILFESDNLTGYPTLDASANDTFGMAMGLNLFADEFAQQLIVEAAMLGVMGNNPNRNAIGDQYGVGVRYQLPLSNSVIFRADAMVGFLRGDEDINGGRMELRKKF